MTRIGFRGLWQCAVLGSAVFLAGGSAQAGVSGPPTASCYFFQDGSGYCSGSLRSFRESSDATALLALQTYVDANDNTFRYVYLTWQSQTKVVFLNSGAALAAAFDRAATSLDGNIYVSFTSDNNISAMQ